MPGALSGAAIELDYWAMPRAQMWAASRCVFKTTNRVIFEGFNNFYDDKSFKLILYELTPLKRSILGVRP